jgi:SAM-dependent methyltransferase
LLSFDAATQGYRNTALASQHLVRGSPRYLGSNLTYQELLWGGWSSLEQIVRTGRPMASLEELLTAGPPGFVPEYLRSVDTVSRAAAEELAQRTAGWPLKTYLDVGGGLGTYARALLAVHPQLQATIFDLPPTLAETAKAMTASPHGARAKLHPGNYLSDELGTGYDLVLFSHVTHDESPATNRELFAKAFRALEPGGWVAVHDFVVEDAGSNGPLFAAMFSLNMLVYTKGGQVFSVAEYRRMLEGAGFISVEVSEVQKGKTPFPSTLVVARKPPAS